jgi:hypothetical protein
MEENEANLQQYLQGHFGYYGQDVGDVMEDEEASENGDQLGSFERLEQLEAEKSMAMLMNNDFRLFEARYNYNKEIRKSHEDKDHNKRNPMYYSEGYEANVDQADDLELSRWQTFFHHIQVVGEGFEEPAGLLSTKGVEIPRSRSSDLTEGEILVENYLPRTKPVSRLQEVKDIVTNVWPDVIEELKPLVKETLVEAERSNVPKDLTNFLEFVSRKMDVEEDVKDDFWD